MKKENIQTAGSKFLETIMPAIIEGGTVRVGYIYWCEMPLLFRDWPVVLSGTVMRVSETKSENGKANPTKMVSGIIKIREIYYKKKTEREDFQKAIYFQSDGGFEGLKAEDKVIVFVDSFDGGYGPVPASGTNCRLGIKIFDFHDPVIEAVMLWIKAEDHAKLVLDKKFAGAWRKYNKAGLDAYIERHNAILEMEKDER